jgi:hypothetical protein
LIKRIDVESNNPGMKRLAGVLLLVMTSIQPNLAHDLEGVYRGDLFSKDNIITLRVKKGAVSGVLFTSANDKHVIEGVIKGRELTGTLNYSSMIWTLNGILIGDSLSLMMSSGQTTRQGLLLRISSNPKTNVPDIIESFSRDKRLVGKWLLLKIENPDGSPKKVDPSFAGMIRYFEANGTSYAELPSMERLIRSLPSYSPQLTKWSTQDSKLTIVFTATNVSKTSSSSYEIRNDTLITISKSEKSFYLRRK